MKNLKNRLTTVTKRAVICGLVIGFSACAEQAPFQPEANTKVMGPVAKKGDKGDSGNHESAYPQSGEVTLSYIKRGFYTPGHIILGQGSMLTIPRASLTPPPGTPKGAPVTITMQAEKVDKELVFTFGPSGCQFSPPVELRLDWSDLGDSVPKLYYIDEKGSYIEQKPDHIDRQGKFFLLYIDHFSRYALGWGE